MGGGLSGAVRKIWVFSGCSISQNKNKEFSKSEKFSKLEPDWEKKGNQRKRFQRDFLSFFVHFL
ncbi:MAG: hypothetical protein HFG64_04545 [Lachnospiraceae bacterium]|nr:hypothetical protein [Lachnospiraceae bacterium]